MILIGGNKGFGSLSSSSSSLTTTGALGTSFNQDSNSTLPPTLETPYNKLPQQLKTEIDDTYQHFIKPTRDVINEIKNYLPLSDLERFNDSFLSSGQSLSNNLNENKERNILEILNENINKASLNATQLTNTQKRLQVSFFLSSILFISLYFNLFI